MNGEAHEEPRWLATKMAPLFAKKVDFALKAYNASKPLGAPVLRLGGFLEPLGLTFPDWSHLRGLGIAADSRLHVTRSHLEIVAAVLKLSQRNNRGADAWKLFEPNVSLDEFENRLKASGFGVHRIVADAALSNTEAYLDRLDRNFPLLPNGLTVRRALPIPRPGIGGVTRAGIATSADLAAEDEGFAPGDEIVLEIRSERPAHVVLLQVTEVPNAQIPSVAVLAPSRASPSPNTRFHEVYLIPTPGNPAGLASFPLRREFGTIEFVALLTVDPIDLDAILGAQAAKPEYRTFASVAQLDALEQALHGAARAKTPQGAPLVLHRQVRVLPW